MRPLILIVLSMMTITFIIQCSVHLFNIQQMSIKYLLCARHCQV